MTKVSRYKPKNQRECGVKSPISHFARFQKCRIEKADIWRWGFYSAAVAACLGQSVIRSRLSKCD